MTKEERFKLSAQKTISKFSNGNCTLKSFVSESYDTTAGTTLKTYSDVIDLPYALDKVENEKIKSYSKDSYTVYLSGQDLGAFVPKAGDLFVSRYAVEFHVEGVETDMYGALYELIVTEVNSG